jgi:cytochrome c biogenesis protein CcmG, thiol:disulfide interchange protein DsbE
MEDARMKSLLGLNKRLFGCGLSLLLASGLAVSAAADATSPSGAPGKMPVFSLPDLDGKEWKSQQFQGKAMVIDFWATWCETCKESVPKLAQLNEKYGSKGLTVVGISVDKGSVEKIKKTAAKLGINYLVLHDKDNTLSKSFGFSGIPSVYVFDRKGNLAKALPGFDPEQEDQLVAATEKAI